MSATLAAIDLALALMARATQISTLVRNAQAEQRDLTTEELDAVVKSDDTALEQLNAAIATAKAEGR